MNIAIHPQAIRHYRQLRNLTQTEFAKKVHVTTDQVSRWERGKVKTIRGHTLKGLVEFLGVSPEQLGKAPETPSARSLAASPKDQLNVRVSGQARNALRLVCHRYNITQEEVIRLAPLLLLITAEASLRRRKEGLSRIWQKLDEAEEVFQEAVRHFLGNTDRCFGPDNELLHNEADSIERRDIFNFEGGVQGQGCPYTSYLYSLTEGTDQDPAIESFDTGNLGSGPDYRIAPDTLDELTGLSRDDEEQNKIRAAIMDGEIDLKEVVTQRESLEPNQYLNWLRGQLEAAEERQMAFERTLDDLLFDFGEEI